MNLLLWAPFASVRSEDEVRSWWRVSAVHLMLECVSYPSACNRGRASWHLSFFPSSLSSETLSTISCAFFSRPQSHRSHPWNNVYTRNVTADKERIQFLLFFTRCCLCCKMPKYRLNQTISMIMGLVENICTYFRSATALSSIINTFKRCGEMSNA